MFLARKPGLRYVKRECGFGWDFMQDDFPADDTWHEKSLSTIVPANAKIVHLHISMIASNTGATFGFKPKGFLATGGYSMLKSQAPNVQNDTTTFIPIGTDGVVQCIATATVTTRMCTVLGWFL